MSDKTINSVYLAALWLAVMAVGCSDEPVAEPDAASNQPDAASSQPDAANNQPDAASNQPDASGPVGPICGPDAGSPPDAASGTAPSLAIVFPPATGLTDTDTIVVRGTVSASPPVAAVRVNGILASTGNDYEDWQVEVPLNFGTNLLIAEVEEADGTVAPNAGHVSVVLSPNLLRRPRGMALDAQNGRALVTESRPRSLLSIDLTTGRRTLISDENTGVGPAFQLLGAVALDLANGRALVGSGADLLAVDLATGDRTTIASDTIGAGPPFAPIRDMVLDVAAQRVLVNEGAYPDHDLMAIDLATGDRTVIASDAIGSGPVIVHAEGLALDTANNRALVVDGYLDILVAIDLTSGDRTILSSASIGSGPLFDFPSSLAPDLANDRVLIVDGRPNMLIAIDLTTGDRTVLSDAVTGAGPPILSPQSVAFDAMASAAIVLDEQLGAVMAIDPISGDRTLLSSAAVGSGPALQYPASIVLDAANDRFLLAVPDPGQVLAIDRTLGVRSVVSGPGVGAGPAFVGPHSLALDPANGRALVGDAALVAVDLADGARTVLSDDTIGGGLEWQSAHLVVLDAPRNRALVVFGYEEDPGNRLVAIDLDNGDRTHILHVGNCAGEMMRADPHGKLLISIRNCGDTGEKWEGLKAVDLATDTLSGLASTYQGTGPSLWPTAAAFDPANYRVLIAQFDRMLLSVDLCTLHRTVLWEPGTGAGPLLAPRAMTLDPERSLLWLLDQDLDALIVFDLVTSQRVIASH